MTHEYVFKLNPTTVIVRSEEKLEGRDRLRTQPDGQLIVLHPGTMLTIEAGTVTLRCDGA